jgi:hypothetical protein
VSAKRFAGSENVTVAHQLVIGVAGAERYPVENDRYVAEIPRANVPILATDGDSHREDAKLRLRQ